MLSDIARAFLRRTCRTVGNDLVMPSRVLRCKRQQDSFLASQPHSSKVADERLIASAETVINVEANDVSRDGPRIVDVRSIEVIEDNDLDHDLTPFSVARPLIEKPFGAPARHRSNDHSLEAPPSNVGRIGALGPQQWLKCWASGSIVSWLLSRSQPRVNREPPSTAESERQRGLRPNPALPERSPLELRERGPRANSPRCGRNGPFRQGVRRSCACPTRQQTSRHGVAAAWKAPQEQPSS